MKANRFRFRAWDNIQAEMIDFSDEDESYNAELDEGGDLFIGSHDGLGDWYQSPSDIILMQSTGLTDKNGKEIFEGDVVYIAGVGLCVVKWDKYDAGWLFDTPDNAYGYQDVIEDIEDVRGNIYENPELLEQS